MMGNFVLSNHINTLVWSQGKKCCAIYNMKSNQRGPRKKGLGAVAVRVLRYVPLFWMAGMAVAAKYAADIAELRDIPAREWAFWPRAGRGGKVSAKEGVGAELSSQALHHLAHVRALWPPFPRCVVGEWAQGLAGLGEPRNVINGSRGWDEAPTLHRWTRQH